MINPFGRFTSSKQVALAVALGVALIAGAVGPALAKEVRTYSQGVGACKSWCDAHNKTTNSQGQCYTRCELYWACNGSDTTQEQCDNTKNGTRTRGDPAPRPRRPFEDNRTATPRP